MSLEDDPFRTVTTYPYLGQVAGLVSCRDLSELPATTEVLRVIKPYKKIERLAELTELRHLELDRLEEGWVGMLGSLPKLEELRITGSKQEAFPALSGLKIAVLQIVRCKKLQNLSFIGELPRLTSLCLSELGRVADLAPLQALPQLRELWIDGSITARATKVESVEPIARLPNLRFLHFQLRVESSDGLRPLLALERLEALELGVCRLEDYELLKNAFGHLDRFRARPSRQRRSAESGSRG